MRALKRSPLHRTLGVLFSEGFGIPGNLYRDGLSGRRVGVKQGFGASAILLVAQRISNSDPEP